MVYSNDIDWFKVGLPSSKKTCFICFNESPLEMMQNAICFILKALFVPKIFDFLYWFFDHVEKTACKSYDITTWLTNKYITQIAQYLNEIWSVNNISQEKCFYSRIMQKIRQRDLFQISFCFLWDKSKSSACFGSHTTWYTIKKDCIKLQNIDPEICSILIF